VFDEPHKKGKSSGDRKHKAYIWRKYDEFENATYIKVTNKTDEVVLPKKLPISSLVRLKEFHGTMMKQFWYTN
jgi:hypothetical protein